MTNLKRLAIMATTSLLLVGCSDENPWIGQQGEGGLKLRLSANSNVTDAVPETRASQTLETPDVSQFAIRLVKTDGSSEKNWQNITEFNNSESFPIGAYTISAMYGDVAQEGFDKPAYYGEASVMVLEGETTQVDVTATLANTMVSIDFSDAFKTFFPDYSAQLHSEGHSYVDVAKTDAGTPVFLAPGKVNIAVTLTQPNTGKTTTIQPAEFEARERHHYHVTLDYNNGGVGEGQFVVRFDDSVVEEDVEIDLTDELFTAPAPKLTATGFTSGSNLTILEGSLIDSPVKFNVNAAGKIKEANLTINSVGKSFSNSSNEINLVTASQADIATLNQWGIDCKGLFKNPDRFAYVDLSNFVKNLPAGNHTVSLQIKDVMTHVSEPMSFSVSIAPVEINVSPKSAIYGGDELLVDLSYNGTDLEENISFQVMNNSGNYVDAPIKSVTTATRNIESKDYLVTLSIPEIDRSKGTVRTFFRGVQKEESTFNVVLPKYSVQTDAFAKHCDVKVVAEDPSLAASIVNKMRVFVIGDNVSPTFTRIPEKGIVRVLNLDPAKTYTLNTTLDQSSNPEYATSTPFTTEAIVAIPNGDFSNVLENSLNISNLQVGGEYKVSPVSYRHKSSILRSEPEGWVSLNPLTAYANASNKNTWFIVPSTWTENGKTIIRSVGYHHAGTTPSETGGAFSTTYYCTNAPSELNRSTGELFLGSYNFDGNAHRTDGINFASRPLNFSFDYTYSPMNNENGRAYIKVLASDGAVLSSQVLKLEAAASETHISVPLTYTTFGKKAAKVEVSFRSSATDNIELNIPSGSALNENQRLGNRTLDANSYHALATGSVLTIDNVAVGYDLASSAAAKNARKNNSKKLRK
ncbi:MAG: DUF4493 domain-containing protein [Prevotella sp.]|nr:DUF4493 domain-containing protein [Bacteroides sp.]MCM1366716.1 DUF4493 domain-containing protein [Prevotella sp.]MCM1437270.1 DUF4493 domain-containing protein [Prevotella sp.]